ncbi:phosphatidylglycerophosphatase A family protein [Urinicoccus massiliensis]|uniref:phosphatidylglycerophosphatase A family protein n=1 Tax=Urinicoccus massiliensis TaxID=1723382 RepID=UPI0009318EEB|nr:phosphatidylglycerophosphatase A [Urinicoccus massiliensis]
MYNYDMEELYQLTVERLKEKGVELEAIAEITYLLQKDYQEDLTMEKCLSHLSKVMHKREIIHAVLTGLSIDEMAEKNLFKEPLQSIIANDEGLYGIDEILPLSIVNVYGSIGLTNFGYLDKKKIGIIKELDERKGREVTTFTDDLVAALAAATASRLAHEQGYIKDREDSEDEK